MPDFTIEGNPGAIRSKVSTMRSKGEMFVSTGDGLSKVTTDGWRSRAGDRFRAKFETEPQRWYDSGDGFTRAASALDAFADALDDAKRRASWAKGEYARGEQVTSDARSAYDADVSRARDKAHAAAAAGQTVTLTIVPFHDPGEAVRAGALKEYADAKSDLEGAARSCASGVRAGCDAAPEKRKWYEKVGAAVGGFLQGAGEALMDLGKLAAFVANPATFLVNDMMGDIGSGMTAEEISAKYQLKLDDAKGMLDALQEDPVGFGKNLGKAMLDWDTWSDDPARALGHLVPDAIAAVFTAGGGAAATRGAKGVTDGLEGLQALSRVEDLADVRHLDDVGGLSSMDDLGDLSRLGESNQMPSTNHVDLDALPDWHQPDGAVDPRAQDLVPDGFERYDGLSRQDYYDRYYDSDGGHWNYPGDDGFTGDRSPNGLRPDDVIDRFGQPRGTYASPAGTPYPDRALPPTSLTDEYNQYRVVKELPPEVTQGDIAPAFGQPGGGTQ